MRRRRQAAARPRARCCWQRFAMHVLTASLPPPLQIDGFASAREEEKETANRQMGRHHRRTRRLARYPASVWGRAAARVRWQNVGAQYGSSMSAGRRVCRKKAPRARTC